MKLHEVTDTRPLIWRLVAQQLTKGKRVAYHAHIPVTDFEHQYSASLMGKVISVSNTFLIVKPYGVYGQSTKQFAVHFGDNDDETHALRPSNDPMVADFVIVDTE